ncbi:type I phosphomannose isomerase catalytic subunit [Robiginitalea sp. SC105]|uniref:type I phosphomannose isomerase catalytic subunit n=1 Tax=Robiginitalea sp. SC105 TaxID=2762332 RepID=UPI00163A719D|nr:class I mannose-6-phosphate isomerase [Robiginitalea sp. SC105]
MYPLKFRPIFKERLWGGTKLQTVLKKGVSGDRVGESWEISGVPGDGTVLSNGPYAGKSLPELIEMDPEGLLGSRVLDRFGREFPILIKFIDARLDLSIQLHPGDTLARKRHNSFGKTEMWYIMDADPGAQLIIGFKEDVSREAYQEALDAGKLPQLLHYQNVSPGDAYFINSGKIHAIGGGILLAEIQQSSDVTYRVYDFNRRDEDGNLRELHTELALDAIDYERREDFILDYSAEPNKVNEVASSPYFTTRYLKLDRDMERSFNGDAFTIYLCTSGEATLTAGDTAVYFRAGETLMLPAACRHLHLATRKCELLEVTV